ncbi:MAG: FecR domain-containing protein, partial [Bacteroidales bacterium]|nr:FecR domain-containing protein [Bacteroidales bacterium]
MESTSSRKEEINLLIISYLTESISKDDLVRLQQWINMSRENRSYFNAFKNAWTLSGKTGISDSSVDESWITFKEKLTLTKEQEVAHPGKKRPVSKYLRIAASWILFMIIGSAVTWLLTDKPRIFEDVKSFEIIVPLGARSEMKMPDGTKIWLNAGTTITYDENYGLETRTLNLTGEAYFDVSKNESRPFIVQTSEITVRALGTKFNVKAYPEDNTISAILEEGAIDVEI